MKINLQLLLISLTAIVLFKCDSNDSEDPQPPPIELSFAEGYPRIGSYTQNSGRVSVKVNKESTVFFIVQSNSIPNPTPEQVKNGTDGNNGTPVDIGQINAEADKEMVLEFDNLTLYDDHIVAITVSDGESEISEILILENKLTIAVEQAKELPHLYTLIVNIENEIIKEEYLNGQTMTDPQDVRSVTKGILALLCGQAIDEGYFTLETTLGEFLPAQYLDGLEQAKKDITVRDLLTMSSGLAYKENEFAAWTQVEDEIVALLSRDLISEPGTTFDYSTPNLQMLSVIFQEATGQTIYDYAKENLFSPLGITNSNWIPFETGYYLAGGFSFIPARGMMNIGLMVKNGGVFDNQQIVPKEFIDEMLTPQFNFSSYLNTGPDAESKWFGYLWWDIKMAGLDGYMTAGYGGQNIIVFPEKDLVITTSSVATVNGTTADQQQRDNWSAIAAIVESLN
ncbi:MAG: serine hydrolase [Fulvivirga sp.]|uniref:serine hydrolase domain-containing protein n=1 Tax=Fulvivirga sp. TaxID=1931237 RepID=UPI0032EBD3B2